MSAVQACCCGATYSSATATCHSVSTARSFLCLRCNCFRHLANWLTPWPWSCGDRTIPCLQYIAWVHFVHRFKASRQTDYDHALVTAGQHTGGVYVHVGDCTYHHPPD